MADLCPCCGAYWECEHKERYRPLLADLMIVSAEIASSEKISITDVDVTIGYHPERYLEVKG